MAVLVDYSWVKFDDGNLIMVMEPPLPIGGLSIEFTLSKRTGGSGYFTKSMASGYYGVSGMNIVNSGQGIMTISLNSVDSSGRDYGNYAFRISRMMSGQRATLTEGFEILLP